MSETFTVGMEGVSRETHRALESFVKQFLKWNNKINLAAASTESELWTRHILDSAQLLPLAPRARRWLDLGSGGGFPGAVVAILLKDRPDSLATLVESHAKKCAFLKTALGALSAPATVLHSRIEDIPDSPVDVVTARALAPLPKLLQLASPWLVQGAHGLFHKGRDYRDEVTRTADDWRFDLIEHQSVVDPESVILEISSLRPR